MAPSEPELTHSAATKVVLIGCEGSAKDLISSALVQENPSTEFLMNGHYKVVSTELPKLSIQLWDTDTLSDQGVTGLIELLKRLKKVDCLLFCCTSDHSRQVTYVYSTIVNVFGESNFWFVSDDDLAPMLSALSKLGYSTEGHHLKPNQVMQFLENKMTVPEVNPKENV